MLNPLDLHPPLTVANFSTARDKLWPDHKLAHLILNLETLHWRLSGPCNLNPFDLCLYTFDNRLSFTPDLLNAIDPLLTRIHPLSPAPP